MEIQLADGTILDAPDDADPSVVAKQYIARQDMLANPTTGGGPPARNHALPKSTAVDRMAASNNALLTLGTSAVLGIPASMRSLYDRIAHGESDSPAAKEIMDVAYKGTPDSQRLLRSAGNQIARVTEPVGDVVRAADKNLASLPGGEVASDILRNTAGTVMDVAGAAPIVPAVAGLARTTGRIGRAAMDYGSGTTTARKVLRGAAGNNLQQILKAMENAPEGLTAAQAAHGIDQDTWQALGELAARNDTKSFYRVLDDAQEAKRASTIREVTPDENAARSARAEASDPLYAVAKDAVVPMDGPIASILERVPKFLMARVQTGASTAGKPFMASAGMGKQGITGEGLHRLKIALDDEARAAPLSSAAERLSSADAIALKNDLLKVMDEAIPEYGQARKAFAEKSPPVNQAQVLTALSGKLEKPIGGERAGPFIAAQGEAKQSLLQRATGQKREIQLTPEQQRALDAVTAELKRDDTLSRQSRSGMGGLVRTLEANRARVPTLPPWFNAKTAVANRALMFIGGSIQRKALDKIVEGMKSGRNAKELLQSLTPEESAELLPLLGMTGAASAASTAAQN